jgi:hypothetical protein
MLGRGDVEADHVADLGDEVGIGRQLEGLEPVRLQAEGAPDALHGRDRHSARPRHAARTPVGGIGRRRFQGAHDHRLDPLILDGAGRSRPGLVAKPVEPVRREASAPLADRLPIHAQPSRYDLVLPALGTSQDDPRPQRQSLSRATARDQRLQFRALCFVQLQRRQLSTAHRHPPLKPQRECLSRLSRLRVSEL